MSPTTHPTREHRFLSVLFCDMVGSTEFQFRMQPEEFETVLSDYRHVVFDLVERHGGHVARVIGDGILAFFGWPRASGNDAQVAVICALEIGRRLRSRTVVTGAAAITARMGIETGWVLVGEIGPPSRSETDGVIGPAPNVAARLQALARANGLVVGEATLALLSPRFLIEAIDTTQLRLPFAISAAHVVGLSDQDGTLGRLRLARRSPLFDRVRELEWLQAGWRGAVAGPGQAMLLLGEPGIGKSRLLLALLDSLRTREYDVIVLFCIRQGTDTPFQAMVEPLAHDMGLGPDASNAEILARADVLAASLTADAEQAAVALAALLGCKPVREVSPFAMRSWTTDALRAWLRAKLDRGPLMLLVEDAHWADASLGAFLHQLIADGLPIGLLIVLTCHSGAEPAWLGSASAALQRLDMPRLPAAEAAELIGTILSDPDAAIVADILKRAEGVPLFISELAIAQARASDTDRRLPGSISQLMAARLDSVGSARAVAQLAAVVGRDVSTELLQALSGMAPEIFESNVEQLVDSGIMVRQGLGRACVLSFRHGMFADAAYQALPGGARRALHRRVADQLRDSPPSWTRATPEMFGYHLERAGDIAEAAVMFCRAATNALAAGGYAEAAANARRSIELAQNADGQQRTALSAHIVLGEALIATQGESSSQVHAVYESATKTALTLNASKELLSPLRGLCAHYQTRGPLHRARELINWLLQLARSNQDALLIADAERRLGWCLLCQGEIKSAQPLLECSVQRFLSAPPSFHDVAPIETDVLGMANLAILSWFSKGPQEARRRAIELIARSEACSKPLVEAYGLGCAAMTLQMCGDPLAVMHAASRTLAVAEAHGITYWVAFAKVLGGWGAALCWGPAPENINACRAGLELYDAVGGRILKPYALMLLAEALVTAGERERAHEALDEARTIARSIGAMLFLPMLAASHGSLAAAGLNRGAREAVTEGMVLARVQGAAALATSLEAMLNTVLAEAQ